MSRVSKYSEIRRLNGGRDRDRTCDPYHVKAKGVGPNALAQYKFLRTGLIVAQPLPNYFSFFIAWARCLALTVA